MSLTPHMPSAHPDLEALRQTEPTPAARAARPWLPRLTITLVVLGLLGAAYAVLQPVFFPPRHVRVASVSALGGADAPRAVASVQAAGWIEAEPFPVGVRPLVPGIVERIDVLEGAAVEQDRTVIAVLRNVALENALVLAAADVALREAEAAQARTALAVATSVLEQRLALRAELVQRQGELATARAEVDRARARRKVMEVGLERAKVELRAQDDLVTAGNATPTALELARVRVREAEEGVTEVRFEEVRFVADLARITNLLELAREGHSDPRELQGRVDEARASVTSAAAALARAQAEREVAQRNVDLLTVRAPMTGVVMRLEAAPGAAVGPEGEFKGSGEGSGSTGNLNRMTGALCTLYDPKRLQVRVDVPYDDLPGIERGTRVDVEVRGVPGRRFPAIVDRIVHEADITQAKLQVKVRLEAVDPALRPEIVCTARFLLAAPSGAPGAGGTLRVLVPTEALRGDAVFVYDPTGGGRARRVPVRVVRRAEPMSEVEGDLGLSARVILDAVREGETVRIAP